MPNNIYQFRRIKWGDPVKMKVLSEDLRPTRHPVRFGLVLCFSAAAAFAIGYMLEGLQP